MPRLAAFPKAFMDQLCADGTMTIREWVDLAATLPAGEPKLPSTSPAPTASSAPQASAGKPSTSASAARPPATAKPPNTKSIPADLLRERD